MGIIILILRNVNLKKYIPQQRHSRRITCLKKNRVSPPSLNNDPCFTLATTVNQGLQSHPSDS